jgi:hypothetical protein
MFFIDVVAVPPTRFRPANVINDKAFSCHMNDLRLSPEGDIERRLLMENNTDIGKFTVFEYVGMKHIVDKSDLPNVDKGFKVFILFQNIRF